MVARGEGGESVGHHATLHTHAAAHGIPPTNLFFFSHLPPSLSSSTFLPFLTPYTEIEVIDPAGVECDVPASIRAKAIETGVGKVLSMSQSGHFSERRHRASSFLVYFFPAALPLSSLP